MKRYAVLFLLLFAGPVFSQTVDLSLKGDGVRVVKVDRVITIKEDATIVQAFPVELGAPKGAGLYFWSYPAGVTASDRGDTLIVNSAPKGSVTIEVKCIGASIGKDGKTIVYETTFAAKTFTVGDVPIPPGPDPKPNPDPEPTDAFYQSLKTGWMKETVADKAMRADLAALYSQSVGVAANDKTLLTAKQLFDRMHAARLTLIKEALPNTRAAITVYLDSVLPRSVSAPLDDATRDKAAAAFDLVAKHLGRLP